MIKIDILIIKLYVINKDHNSGVIKKNHRKVGTFLEKMAMKKWIMSNSMGEFTYSTVQ